MERGSSGVGGIGAEAPVPGPLTVAGESGEAAPGTAPRRAIGPRPPPAPAPRPPGVLKSALL